MAIATVSPATLRQRNMTSKTSKSKQPDLKLVAETTSNRGADRKVFAIFLTSMAVAGLLALLAINTALSQGAFELSKLTAQAVTLNDQREAVMKKIAKASSPEVLAYRAKAAGMVPSQSPRFLIVGASNEGSTATQSPKVTSQ